MLQAAALQVVCELALHMHRQCPLTRRQVFHERRAVVFNQLIQERLFGTVTSICARMRWSSDGVLAGQ